MSRSLPERLPPGPADPTAAVRRHLREAAPLGPRTLRDVALSLRLTVPRAMQILTWLMDRGEVVHEPTGWRLS